MLIRVRERVLSPQEQRIEQGCDGVLPTDDARARRARIDEMLRGFRDTPPRVSIDRARFFTESFKETEDLPLVLRWAKAEENVLNKIPIYIGAEELIVGRCGPPGRHGLVYPETRAGWAEEALEELPKRRNAEGKFILAAEDLRVFKEEITPYWKGKTLHELYIRSLPDTTRRILFGDDSYGSAGIIQDASTIYNSLHWAACDYRKVLEKGLKGIKQEAQERLASLHILDAENNYDKEPFLKAVYIVCDAVIGFANRYASLAERLADNEPDRKRKEELLEIARVCRWVPENPATSFYEAVQSFWFTNVALRLEQVHATVLGNGRIDQYLLPFYRRDIEEGKLNEDGALEILACLWLNMAQYVLLNPTRILSYFEGYAHFEQTTIGGQTKDGNDATNELSYLMLRSKKEFPLDYPDLSVRIHSRTPERFLRKVCELIKEGTGFPKLLNDEAIIPMLMSKGVPPEEARDYVGSGCVDGRVPNWETDTTPPAIFNMAAALVMALNNGLFEINGKLEQIGVKTGDPRDFKSFGELMDAFKRQMEYLLTQYFIRRHVADMTRPSRLAAPLESSLHGLCMRNCLDIHQGSIPGGIKVSSCDQVGLGTVVDSLIAVKKLVYEEQALTIDEMLQALAANFESHEATRQMCLNAPKYGNNDAYVDDLARDIDAFLVSVLSTYKTIYGTTLSVAYVPVTHHVSLGRHVGATPDGRKAKEALSEGVAASQGCDTNGPTAALLSVARSNSGMTKYHNARLLNMKFSPAVVDGETGTRTLMSLIRTWCDLKLWHIQFNIVNVETLLEAQRNPEKYRNLLIRVAGYSAYFVDLSPELQAEIIKRTTHQSI